mgnify:CR=1 FL=1
MWRYRSNIRVGPAWEQQEILRLKPRSGGDRFIRFGGSIRFVHRPKFGSRKLDKALGLVEVNVVGFSSVSGRLWSLLTIHLAQIRDVLGPQGSINVKAINALLRCIPSRDYGNIAAIDWASPDIAIKATARMIEKQARETFEFMELIVRDPLHPGRALVGSMVETVFRAALGRGVVFPIRRLSTPPPALRSGGKKRKQNDGAAASTSDDEDVAEFEVAVVSREEYLSITCDAEHKLSAEIIAQLPDGMSVYSLGSDVLIPNMDTRDTYWSVDKIKACPARRLIFSLQKNAGAIDALIKGNPVPALLLLLFQFTLSLHHGISWNAVAELRKEIGRQLSLFFVVPNRHLYQNFSLQPYKFRQRCPHDHSMQCLACAAADTHLTQYVLLCELPAWHDLEYSEAGLTAVTEDAADEKDADVLDIATMSVQPSNIIADSLPLPAMFDSTTSTGPSSSADAAARLPLSIPAPRAPPGPAGAPAPGMDTDSNLGAGH